MAISLMFKQIHVYHAQFFMEFLSVIIASLIVIHAQLQILMFVNPVMIPKHWMDLTDVNAMIQKIKELTFMNAV